MTPRSPAISLIVAMTFLSSPLASSSAEVRATLGGTPQGAATNPYRSCGLNSLYAVAKLKNSDVSLKEIEKVLRPREDGDRTLADLERAARSLDFDSITARGDLATLARAPLPAILQLKSPANGSTSSHYVVCLALQRDGIVLLDPPGPATTHPYEEFRAEWTGVIVAFPADSRQRLEFEESLRGDQLQTPSLLGIGGLAGVALAFASGSKGGGMGLVMISICLFAAVGCRKSDAKPRLSIAANPTNLGVLELGPTTFELEIRNPGDAPLLISGVASSCSCTASDQTLEVPPGKSGRLRGTVSVQSGPGSAELRISSNGAEGLAKTVRLVWAGKGVLTLTPDTIHLVGRAGEVAVKDLEVSYPSSDVPEPLVFLGLSGFPEGVKLASIGDDPFAIRSDPGLATSPNISPSPFVGKAKFRLEIPIPTIREMLSLKGVVRLRHRGFIHELPLLLQFEQNLGIRYKPDRLLFSGTSIEALRAIERKVVLTSDDPTERLEVERVPDYMEVTLKTSVPHSGSTILVARIISPPGVSPREEIIIKGRPGRRVSIPVLISFEP